MKYIKICLPKNVEDLPVRMNSDQQVWHGNKLEVSFLSIRKEDFWLPNCLTELWVCQVEGSLKSYSIGFSSNTIIILPEKGQRRVLDLSISVVDMYQ